MQSTQRCRKHRQGAIRRAAPHAAHRSCSTVASARVDPLAQPGLRHAGRRRINRRQRRGQRLALSDRTNARMNHLHARESAARHTEGAHALADCQLLRLRGVEVQKTQDQRAPCSSCTVTRSWRRPRNTTPAAVTTASTCASSPSLQLVDRHEDGFVLIAQRQMQDEIPVGSETDRVEPRGDVTATLARGGRGGGARFRQDVLPLQDEDGLDLELRALRQARDTDGRARRIRLRHHFAHDLR